MQKYTYPPIYGKKLNNVLPDGTALVLEGGGLRGYYSAGVMESFMEHDLMFPYIIGVSAGAANALSYISGQFMRNRQIIENYVTNPHYVSKRNLIFKGSIFDFNYIFNTIPGKYIFFDWDSYIAQSTCFLTGATNCADGKTVWFEKEDITPLFEATVASCSLPFLTKIQHFKGYDLVDGGVSNPIPIEKSIADGNKFHVIVLTRNKGYRKEAFPHDRILRMICRKYPSLADAILNRHTIYNHQLELCEKLEKEGKAIIIRPEQSINVGRTSATKDEILKLHDEGYDEGNKIIPKMLEILKKVN